MLLLTLALACAPRAVTVEPRDTETRPEDSGPTSDTGDDTDTDTAVASETGADSAVESSSPDTAETGAEDTSDTGLDDSGEDSAEDSTEDTAGGADTSSCDDVGVDVQIEGLELTCEDGVYTLTWSFSGIADYASTNVHTNGDSMGAILDDDGYDIACCGSLTLPRHEAGCDDAAYAYVAVLPKDDSWGGMHCGSTGMAFEGCDLFDEPVTCDDPI